MARKSFNFVCTTGSVTVQRLAYDGDEVSVAEEKTFAVADLPAQFGEGEAAIDLAAYGLSQLLQDRVSSFQADEKLEQMDKVFANLMEGQWKATRASGTGGAKKASISPFFAEGFSRFLQSNGKDIDAATATVILQDMDKDGRAAMRTHPSVKPFIEQAEAAAQKAAGEVDLESLLG